MMLHVFSSRVARGGLVALVCAVAAGAQNGPLAIKSAWSDALPVQISAVYKISLNNFEIGNFQYNSNVGSQSYTLESNVELSAMLGAFHWQGATRTSGTVVGSDPKPSGYSFDFTSTAKSGSIKMSFNPSGVSSVSVAPEAIQPSDVVPLQEQHVRDVLDPLSAIMMLTHADGPNPCSRKVSIFDGKQRFDLILSYRRQERIAEAQPSGQPETAVVCKIKYVPIAGYRPTEETKAMAQNNGIEITFRPIPSANLMVPHQIVIPTVAGTAELIVQRVNITAPGREEIALVN
jgi:hypothetical protein